MPTQTGSIDLSSQKKAHDEAAKVATNYITVDSTRLMVADGDGSETPSTATTRNVFIDSDSVDIRDGQESRASFGEIVRLGKEYVYGSTGNQDYIEIDGSSFNMFDKSGDSYVNFRSLTNAAGLTIVTETFVGNGFNNVFTLGNEAIDTNYTVEAPEGYSVLSKTKYEFTLNRVPQKNAVFTASYETLAAEYCKAFTLGERLAGAVGLYSYSEGYANIAAGEKSHAEGSGNKVYGSYSHAEGINNTIYGSYSHAEGIDNTTSYEQTCHVEGKGCASTGGWSHAEGYNSEASGGASHAEGMETTSSGLYSHSQNRRTIAAGNSQTAIGKYNEQDSTSALIIGNGTADNARSNAFTVDWGGNVEAAGEVKAGGSTPLVPIGTILDFAAATPPTGYLTCDGSAVSRTDYAALFAVIGTTWGAGDGSTTFNLPDFRGRTSIGAGTGTATDATAHALGASGGTETVKLTAAQSGVPAHSHPLPNSSIVYNANGTQRLATSGSGTLSSVNTNVGLSTANNTAAGASSAHSNMQPFATVTKIIRAL